MMDLSKLHALADGELSEQESQLVREQVLTSEEAGRELSAIYNLKDCVRSKAQIFTCEVTFVASMKRVAELDRKKKVDGFVTRYAWGLSGAFAALIVIGGVMSRTAGSHRVQTADIASAYVGLPMSSSRPVTVPPGYNHWLDTLMRNAQGMSHGDMNGHDVLKVMLRGPYGLMGLLVIQGDVSLDDMAESPSSPGYFIGRIQGHNGVARKDGSQLLVLLGDQRYDDLLDVLRHIGPVQP